MKKKLVFYLYGSNTISNINKLHFQFINLFEYIFDELQFVISVENNNQQTFEKYKTILQSNIETDNAEFIMIQNDFENRDFYTFKTFVIDQIPKLKNTYLFYAKSDDTSFADLTDKNTIYKWIMSMYYFNLNYIDDVEAKFEKGFDAYGSLPVRDKEAGQEWHFTGSFQWFNCNNFNNEFEHELIERIINEKSKNKVSESFLQYITTIDKVSFYNSDVTKPVIKKFDDFTQLDDYLNYIYGTEETVKFNNWVSNNDKLDIFVCAHKNFDIYPKNLVYKVIYGENNSVKINLKNYIEKDEENSLYNMNLSYGEGSRIYWIWKHVPLKEYIGINHYRCYFDFFDKVPNITEIFKTHDVILGSPAQFGCSIKEQYAKCHNLNDLNAVEKIINRNYPEFSNDFNIVMSRNLMYLKNIFIMRKDDFYKYCEFIFSVLSDFDDMRNFKTEADVCNYVQNHKEEYENNQNPSLMYQSRLDGFLMERLTNVFIQHYFKKPMIYNFKVTQDVGWTENDNK